MAAFAMFSLKDPSLLAFQDRLDDPTLKNLYRIDKIPSDTQMRDILDPVEVDQLNECFADLFHELQRGGVLKKFVFWMTITCSRSMGLATSVPQISIAPGA